MADQQAFYAHTPPKDDPDRWHLLRCHLEEVARIAAESAAAFGAQELARWAGWLHDIGKFNSDFQNYLKECYEADQQGGKVGRKGPPHAIYGAIEAMAKDESFLPFVIACHHGGLPNSADLKARLHPNAAKREAGREIEPVLKIARSFLPDIPCEIPFPAWIDEISDPSQQALACEFFLRMLFSCLIDADRLDTERHKNPERAEQRAKPVEPQIIWPELWRRFEREHARLTANAAATDVNAVRKEVYEACVRCGEEEQGIFRLTVPTGGGKTLSSLAFALRHACKHGLDRIIVAIPYTSIIDQTADIYRRILGAEYVLEHHSALAIPENPDEAQQEAEMRRQLASENWDVPIVVTTTVQLFESLFSDRTSRCRKLHNIARSVLILDEVQTLPLPLLEPLVSAIQELADHYHVSPVLCTATQPAFAEAESRLTGLKEVREIVPEYRDHFQRLRRVEYYALGPNEAVPITPGCASSGVQLEPIDWNRLADRIRAHPQSLTVVNSRKDALALLDALGCDKDACVFHLSTLLCGAHRRDVLAAIRRRLDPTAGEPCTLISTQVVECGVDIDFPVVFRAVAPLDRVAQSAGRCNRENRRSQPGMVYLFKPEQGKTPSRAYRTGMTEAERLLDLPDTDLHDPDLYLRYFRILYDDLDPDAKKVQNERSRFNFETVARVVRLIEDDTVAVVVRYDAERIDDYDAERIDDLLEEVRRAGSVPAEVWRAFQPYTVSLYRRDFDHARNAGSILEVAEGLYVWHGPYDRLRGIAAVMVDPADLIV